MGEWKKGQINGKGILYYPNGSKYEIDWEKGNRNIIIYKIGKDKIKRKYKELSL
jgi:hypothetical protein